jgi:aspartyl-tRNA(Asn)/glutamyl-tRNA(Gln) amidotransferase subunit A
MMSFKELVRSLHSGEKSFKDLAHESREKALLCKKDTNAFLQVFDEKEILSQVDFASALVNSGAATALTGVPVAIKENILIKGHRASAGSKMLDAHTSLYDAHVVSQLRAAGAVIVGTTNLDEFAMGSSNESSYYGSVVNPRDHSRVPGGSSGGSAAAVAYGAVPLALGTDTGGSVRQPAAFCGVVGYKPSYGRISRHGVVAFASSLDQVGVLASDVLGAAAVAEVIHGVDVKDATTEDMSELSLESLLADPLELSSVSFAVIEEAMNTKLDTTVLASWNDAQSKLKSAGLSLSKASVPAWNYALETYYLVCCSEASSNLSRYDGVRYGHRTKSGGDLEALYAKSRAEGFGTEVKQRILLGTLALSSGYFDAYFKKAAEVRRLLVNQMNAVFVEHEFIVMPTSPTVAFELKSLSGGTLEMYENDIFTVGVNLAGLPAISIVAPTTGLPVGLQIIGKRGADAKLLKVASLIEELLL